ncbi:hypothetical protein JCM11641_008217 [Rhodosporidiobolus odoratus]
MKTISFILSALLASSALAHGHDSHDRQALHRRAAAKQAGWVRRNKRQPVGNAALLAVDESTSAATATLAAATLPQAEAGNWLINGTALWFYETGATGACLQVNTDDDLVMGLSDVFWNNTGVASPYCGQQVVVTNTDNGKNVTVTIADASGKEYTTLTRAAFLQLSPLTTGMIPIQYHFLNGTSAASSSSTSSKVSHKGSSSASAQPASAKPEAVFTPSQAVKAIVSTTRADATTAASTSTYDSADAESASQAAAAQASREAKQAAQDAAASLSSQAAAEASQHALVLAASQSAEAAAASSSSRAAAAASSKAASEAAASSSAAVAAAASAKAKTVSSSISHIFGGGIATYFYQNGVAGNCGTVHSDSTPLVALPTKTYASGKHCGQTVTIKRVETGDTITALVADSCPTCNNDNCLDLSVGAYKSLGGTEAMGVFDIEWWFN